MTTRRELLFGAVPALMMQRSGTNKAKGKLTDLDEMIDLACADRNFNYSPYMHGLANGLILARSVLTGEEAKFAADPKGKWPCDLPKIGRIDATPAPPSED